MVDEAKHGGIGPVEVLEHHEERDLRRDCSQKAAPSREGLVLLGRPHMLRCGQPDQGRKSLLEPNLIDLVRNDGGHSCAELPRRLPGIVRFEDPSVGLDHLSKRPEGHPLSGGRAAALTPRYPVRLAADESAEFLHQPGLANPGSPTMVTSWAEVSATIRR